MPVGFDELIIGGGGNDAPSEPSESTIPGSGTYSDPYLVSNVEELHEAISLARTSSLLVCYIELTSNIDGKWDAWETIDYYSNRGAAIDLNLNYHYIRNFMCNGAAIVMNDDVIRNGVFYNFYTNTTSDNIWYGIQFDNVCISNYIKNLNNVAVYHCEFHNGGIWATVEECNVDSYVIFKPYDALVPDDAYQFEESDSKVVIKHLNSLEFNLFKHADNVIIARLSRIQGGIESITPDEIDAYPAIMDSDVGFIDSVINFEMPAYSGTVTSGTATTIVGTGTTGIINSDKILEQTYADYTMLNLIPVTNTEILDADELTAKGFTVYDISEGDE